MLFLLSFYNVFFFYSSIENHLDKRPVHAHGLPTSFDINDNNLYLLKYVDLLDLKDFLNELNI